MRTNAENFVKIVQTSRPWGTNLWPKIAILTVLGAIFLNFCPRGSGPLPRAKFHVYRGNMSPLRGEKPIFWPLSKNNTCMAALRAGLPVKITDISLVTDMISIYRKETISKVQMWYRYSDINDILYPSSPGIEVHKAFQNFIISTDFEQICHTFNLSNSLKMVDFVIFADFASHFCVLLFAAHLHQWWYIIRGVKCNWNFQTSFEFEFED